MIFDNVDLFSELVKYLSFRNLLTIKSVFKLYQRYIEKIIYNAEEYKFLKDNNITVVNKSFQLSLNIDIDIDKLITLNNFTYHHKTKRKGVRIRYVDRNIIITLKSNKLLLISGCKSRIEAKQKINEMLSLLYDNNIVDYIPNLNYLEELSTTIEFRKDIYSKKIVPYREDYRLVYDKNLSYTSKRKSYRLLY
jgi:hypothetical protein